MHLHPFFYTVAACTLIFQGCASSQKTPNTVADVHSSQSESDQKTAQGQGEQKLIASMLKNQGQDKLINAALKNSEITTIPPRTHSSSEQPPAQTEPQNAVQTKEQEIKSQPQIADHANATQDQANHPNGIFQPLSSAQTQHGGVQTAHPQSHPEHISGNSDSHYSGSVSIKLLGEEPQIPPANPVPDTVEAAPEAEQTPPPEINPDNQIDYAAERHAALKELRQKITNNPSKFWSFVDQDPLMTQTLDREVRPHGTNSISALGGGSTVSFKYVDTADESAKAALKPDQDLRQTMYRSEIAYYRLCQILECSFDTPVTRPVRFSSADFNALYNASTSSKNKGYRIKFDHLIWEKENGTKYLYAAYKEWISPFDGFPIEATNVWSPYLTNPKADLPSIEKFMHRLLTAGRPADVKNLNTFLGYLGNMTTRDLLQQISDIILIDYLTNNWDRFAGEVTNYGANCHFQPGGIIAIDNGAAFPSWHAPRVVRRLNLVQMFSKDLVNNLRMLDEDELLRRLFPNPTNEEKKSYARFKERRRDALKYIDGLIEKKGVNNVLVF